MNQEQPTIATRIGFVGAGTIAAALIQGILSAGLAPPHDLVAFDVSQDRTRHVEAWGVRIARDNGQVARIARVVFLCVKPKDVRAVLGELAPWLTADHLVVSVAAGVRLSFLEACLPPGVRVVRVMPNLPVVVGEVAAACATGTLATPEDAGIVERIFGSMGICVPVDEDHLDTVTGLSGSGPAYVYAILEGLIRGAVEAGLPEALGRRLAAQTLRGAATLVLQDDRALGDLIKDVATPGGTTAEGLKVMAEANLEDALARAVVAAGRRAKELAQG